MAPGRRIKTACEDRFHWVQCSLRLFGGQDCPLEPFSVILSARHARNALQHGSEGAAIPVIFQALFSALLIALALPNEVFLEGLWPLGLIALVPLYRSLKSSKSFGQAALCGAVFGSASHTLTSYWLFFYRGFAFWTLGTTTIAYGAVYAVAACYAYFVLEATPTSYRPFIFALGWVVLEFLKSSGFLGYPWGISFILALASGVIAEFRGIGIRTPGSRPEQSPRNRAGFLSCLRQDLWPRQALVPARRRV